MAYLTVEPDDSAGFAPIWSVEKYPGRELFAKVDKTMLRSGGHKQKVARGEMCCAPVAIELTPPGNHYVYFIVRLLMIDLIWFVDLYRKGSVLKEREKLLITIA